MIASRSQIIYRCASDASRAKEDLFGSYFSDKDPTYVLDLEENIQNDSGSDCNVKIPKECENNTGNQDFFMLVLDNLLDRV